MRAPVQIQNLSANLQRSEHFSRNIYSNPKFDFWTGYKYANKLKLLLCPWLKYLISNTTNLSTKFQLINLAVRSNFGRCEGKFKVWSRS